MAKHTVQSIISSGRQIHVGYVKSAMFDQRFRHFLRNVATYGRL